MIGKLIKRIFGSNTRIDSSKSDGNQEITSEEKGKLDFDENELNQPIVMEESYTKNELIKRLKELANDTTEYVNLMGAMCYSRSFPSQETETCDCCGCEFSLFYGSLPTKDELERLNKKIKQLGHNGYFELRCN